MKVGMSEPDTTDALPCTDRGSLGALLRPEGEDWHRIRAVEDADEQTDEAKDWLADTEGRMRDAFEAPASCFPSDET